MTKILIFMILNAFANLASAQLLCNRGTSTDLTSFPLRKDGSGNFSVCGNFEGPTDLNPGEGELMSPDLVEFGGMALYLDTNMEVVTGLIYPNTQSSPRRMLKDSNQFIYVFGSITNEIDLNTGEGEFMLYADNPYGDGANFIACYNPQLELEWAIRIGNAHGSLLWDAILLENGNIVTTGVLTEEYDMDPGVGELVAEAYAPFIAEYSPAGELISYNAYSPLQGQLTLSKMEKTADNHVLIIGYFYGLMDMDPTANDWFLGSENNDSFYDGFLIEFDDSMNFLRALAIGGNDVQNIENAVVDEFGNLFLSGYFGGVTDFDPGPANTNTIMSGFTSGFLAKYDANWNYQWVKRVRPQSSWSWASFTAFGMYTDSLIITSGFSVGSFYIDNGETEQFMTSDDPYYGDAFIAAFNPVDGELIWAQNFGTQQHFDYIYLGGIVSDQLLFDGFSGATMDMNPWTEPSYLLETDGDKYFIAKYGLADNEICPDVLQVEMINNTTSSFFINGIDMGVDVFWEFGDGFEWDGGNVAIHEFEPGIYLVQATFTDPDCAEGVTTLLAEIQVFECLLSLSVDTDLNGTSTLVAEGFNTSDYYSWDLGDGVQLEGDSTLIYQYDPGQYYPCVTNTSANCPLGVTACSSVLICAQDESQISIESESMVWQNGPQDLDWQILDMNGDVIITQPNFYSSISYTNSFQVCLSDGCYQVGYCIIDPNYSIEAFDYAVLLDGQELILEDITEYECGNVGIFALGESCGMDYWCDSAMVLNTNIGMPGNISFQSLNSYPLSSYSWTLNDEVICTSPSGAIQISQSGTYLLCLSVSNEFCSFEQCQEVEISIPDLVVEGDQIPVEVYPNPANQSTIIQWHSIGGMEKIRVSDACGRLVYNENCQTNRVELITSDWAPGVYVVNFCNNQAVYNVQLMIER